jgi:capsule biosynthesis phosphatase
MKKAKKGTLVVDIDDTICTTINRDYDNAIPHTEIIEKLNTLYRNGWEIVYYTARGQLSLNENLEEIKRLKIPEIRAWLNKHNVFYHDLIVGKPYGTYYIDDKALRPDEFLKLEIS